jgi:hypothetical protein
MLAISMWPGSLYVSVQPKALTDWQAVWFEPAYSKDVFTDHSVSCPPRVSGLNQVDYCELAYHAVDCATQSPEWYVQARIEPGASYTYSVFGGNKCNREWALRQYTLVYTGNGICESEYGEYCGNAEADCGKCTAPTVTTTTLQGAAISPEKRTIFDWVVEKLMSLLGPLLRWFK